MAEACVTPSSTPAQQGSSGRSPPNRGCWVLAVPRPWLIKKANVRRKAVPLVWLEPQYESNAISSTACGRDVFGSSRYEHVLLVTRSGCQPPGAVPRGGFAAQQPAEEEIKAAFLLSVSGGLGAGSACQANALGLFFLLLALIFSLVNKGIIYVLWSHTRPPRRCPRSPALAAGPPRVAPAPASHRLRHPRERSKARGCSPRLGSCRGF